jgi:hypothetical protein
MYLKISQLNGPFPPPPPNQNIHPQLINMTLQEGLVIKIYNTIIYKVRKTTL